VFRSKIEGMLITASWFETLQELIGLRAVSQVWDDKPAWYFWKAGADGVYHLQTAETRIVQSGQMPLYSAIFLLKFYPFPRGRMFPCFSFEEQCYIQSNYFDKTHTPYYVHQKKIPENLFHVAVLEYSFHEDHSVALLTFESLNTLRQSHTEDMTQEYSQLGRRKRFKKGAIDRRVPGIEIGYPFFDLLLCLFAKTEKRPPSRVTISRGPGFEYVTDESVGLTCIDAPDIQISTVKVWFADRDMHQCMDSVSEVIDPFREDDMEVILDRWFTCGHVHDIDPTAFHPTPMNPLWWSLAEADFASHLASACGCA
jgi:hypothetical protein